MYECKAVEGCTGEGWSGLHPGPLVETRIIIATKKVSQGIMSVLDNCTTQNLHPMLMFSGHCKQEE